MLRCKRQTHRSLFHEAALRSNWELGSFYISDDDYLGVAVGVLMCSRGLVRDRIVVLRERVGLLSSQLAELQWLRGRVEEVEKRRAERRPKLSGIAVMRRRLQR